MALFVKRNKLERYLVFFTLTVFLLGCNTENQGDEIPVISNVLISKSTMRQGDLNQDSLWVQFTFEDGDGDLGFGSQDSRHEIFIQDSRTNALYNSYKIPDLPPSNGAQQKGQINLLVFTTCCLFPNPIPPCSAPVQFPTDSLFFIVYIKDRAGHLSDTLQSPLIWLACN